MLLIETVKAWHLAKMLEASLAEANEERERLVKKLDAVMASMGATQDPQTTKQLRLEEQTTKKLRALLYDTQRRLDEACNSLRAANRRTTLLEDGFTGLREKLGSTLAKK